MRVHSRMRNKKTQALNCNNCSSAEVVVIYHPLGAYSSFDPKEAVVFASMCTPIGKFLKMGRVTFSFLAFRNKYNDI